MSNEDSRQIMFRLRPVMVRWLMHQANHIILPRVQALAYQVGLKPSAVYLSKAGCLLGSCSAWRVVRINWRLVQAPVEVVDYVIYHELAHLQHMNHSKAFWSLVVSWCPKRIYNG